MKVEVEGMDGERRSGRVVTGWRIAAQTRG